MSDIIFRANISYSFCWKICTCAAFKLALVALRKQICYFVVYTEGFCFFLVQTEGFSLLA